jgi:enoyl-CoA hydratase/long-chain 3-hydroxyacyl-CoA dehydrogenase
MLQSYKTAEEVTKLSADGQNIMQLIENSRKPVVAAIMGSCMGGGLEVCRILCEILV